MPWARRDTATATFTDGSGGHTLTYPAGPPAAGELLVLGVASDTVVATPPGWTLAVSDVVNQGDYAFYRLAGAGEAASVVLTTSGDFPTAATYLRYAGNTAAPLDRTAAVHVNNLDAAASPAIAPPALIDTNELALLFACNQQSNAGAPTAPVPTAGYAVLADTGIVGTGGFAVQQYVIGRTDATGAQAPQVAWSSAQFLNRSALFVSFVADAVPPATRWTAGAPATSWTARAVPTRWAPGHPVTGWAAGPPR